MKTYKNLYPKIYNFSNLYRAYRAARKGKRDRVAVASFELELERNLIDLSDELKQQTYAPGKYTNPKQTGSCHSERVFPKSPIAFQDQ